MNLNEAEQEFQRGKRLVMSEHPKPVKPNLFTQFIRYKAHEEFCEPRERVSV